MYEHLSTVIVNTLLIMAKTLGPTAKFGVNVPANILTTCVFVHVTKPNIHVLQHSVSKDLFLVDLF